jgi:regulator of extracellular matrix RemA (YlzA/DUF370 family)
MMKLAAGQSIAKSEILLIANPSAESVRHLLRVYSQKKKCLDLTRGRAVNSLLLTDEDQIVLLPFKVKTVVDRLVHEGEDR